MAQPSPQQRVCAENSGLPSHHSQPSPNAFQQPEFLLHGNGPHGQWSQVPASR